MLQITDGLSEGEEILLQYMGNSGLFSQYPPAEGLGEGLAVWHADASNHNADIAEATAFRVHLVEADGNGSLLASPSAVDEPGDLLGLGAMALLSNDGTDPSIELAVPGGVGGPLVQVNLDSSVPWLWADPTELQSLPGASIPLQWTPASGATGYRIERGRPTQRVTLSDGAEDANQASTGRRTRTPMSSPWARWTASASVVGGSP